MEKVLFCDYKKDLEHAYQQLITDTKEQRAKESNENHVMMGAVVGKNYQKGGTMIIGRATNGWFRYDLNIKNLFNGDTAIFDIPEQMKKIKDLYSFDKGFWKIIKSVYSGLYPQIKDFENYIVYSNYCKIAGQGSNPSAALAKAQVNACNNIIDLELKITAPHNLVVFTGCQVENEFSLYSEPLMNHLFKQYGSNFDGCWKPYFVDRIIWDNERNYGTEVYKVAELTIFLTEHPLFKNNEAHSCALIKLMGKYK